MFEWIKNHRVISIVIMILLFLFFIIVMPLILNWIYYLDAPCNFFTVGYDISDILGYYGAILTFIGTISLGIITVYQNYVSQKKTDEINKLTLELQKRSMAMAEQNYEREKQHGINKNTPKFELVSSGCNGNYTNLEATLKNVSDFTVSGIKSVSFEVFDESNNTIVTTSNKVKSDMSSLSSGQETKIRFHNTGFIFKGGINAYGQQVYDSLKNITIIWGFQCEDSCGIINYYKAKLFIEDSKDFVADTWEVKVVG
ncbi:MAG TPA: hypothetical protein DEF85_06350 [Clostridiaceae bacterium]|nr:hypothetical protein [Clostridiaceae bacterium]HBX48494.1 hypothetical protein [Clostridiaceae bacterium]